MGPSFNFGVLSTTSQAVVNIVVVVLIAFVAVHIWFSCQ